MSATAATHRSRSGEFDYLTAGGCAKVEPFVDVVALVVLNGYKQSLAM
jgi:hypothetical protein